MSTVHHRLAQVEQQVSHLEARLDNLEHELVIVLRKLDALRVQPHGTWFARLTAWLRREL
jgi:hypothetical protein